MAKHHKTRITAEPGKQEIVITRAFDAPRELGFKACTDPKLSPQWWRPRRYTTTIDRMEPKKGGTWRFIQKGPDGEFAFNGVYHEVVSPKRMI